jgi:hypothetical protein
MGTISSDRGLSMPTNGADNGVWGPEVLATFSAVDNILGGSYTYLSSQGNWTPTSSQSQAGRLVIGGVPTAAFILTGSPTNYALGNFTIWNQTSASVLCTTGTSGTYSSGTTCVVPAGTLRLVNFDGVNAQFADQAVALPAANINFNYSGGGVSPNTGWMGAVEIPFTFTPATWQLFSDGTAGSVTVYHANYANWAGTSEATVSLSGASKNTGTYASSNVYVPGDIMGFINSAAVSGTFISINIIGTRSLSS